MIVWEIPGWKEAHANLTKLDVMELIGKKQNLIAEAWKGIKKDTDADFESEFVIDLKEDGYEITTSKLKKYSATFPEFVQIVKTKTVYDTMLVTPNCYVHGIAEQIARIYDLDSAKLEYIDNETSREMLERVLNSKGGSHVNMPKEDVIFFKLFYSSGLRFDDVVNLKIGNLDLRKGTINIRRD